MTHPFQNEDFTVSSERSLWVLSGYLCRDWGVRCTEKSLGTRQEGSELGSWGGDWGFKSEMRTEETWGSSYVPSQHAKPRDESGEPQGSQVSLCPL